MTSIIKVDTIQTAAGGTPTAASLGLNVTGSVVQVVTNVVSAQNSSTSSSLVEVNTSFRTTITPKSTSNKILVTANICYGGVDNLYGIGEIYRSINGGSYSLVSPQGIKSGGSSQTAAFLLFSHSNSNEGSKTRHEIGMFEDSPNTIQPVIYTLYYATMFGSLNLTINRSSTNSNNSYERPSVSTITLMEIAG
jgi:hypothetical protein